MAEKGSSGAGRIEDGVDPRHAAESGVDGEDSPRGGVIEVTGRLPAGDGGGLRYFHMVCAPEGILKGDPLARAQLYSQASLLEGEAVGPAGGPYTHSRHLEHPLSALELITSYMPALHGWEVEVLEGYVPSSPPPQIPEDAIV